MYKMSKVVFEAMDGSMCFLTFEAAESSGKRYRAIYVPIYETYPIGEKHAATRRRLG